MLEFVQPTPAFVVGIAVLLLYSLAVLAVMAPRLLAEWREGTLVPLTVPPGLWRVEHICAGILGLALAILLTGPVSSLVTLLRPLSETALIIVRSTAFQLLLIMTLVLVYALSGRTALLRGAPRLLLAAAALQVAFWPLIAGLGQVNELLLRFFGMPPQMQLMVEVLLNTDSLPTIAAICFSAVVLAPLMEELLFRGLLYPWLKTFLCRSMTPRQAAGTAMVIVSALFAAIHDSRLTTLLPLTLLGCLFTLGFERTGRLSTAVAMHMAFNAVSCALILLLRLKP